MPIKLFSLNSGHAFAQTVANHLNSPLAEHEERDFENGEHKIRPLENVDNADVHIVESLYGEPGLSVNDKLLRLLFFIGALRDAGAGRITVIAPFLCYTRKDRRTKPYDPLTNRYVAQLFEAMRIDRLATFDVHNKAAFENAFRCPTIHLTAHHRLTGALAARLKTLPVCVCSPDVGGIKRAEDFRQILAPYLDATPTSAFMEKYRSEGVLNGTHVVGDVKDRVVIMIDDLVASGDTLQRAAEAFLKAGAAEVSAAVTHGVFSERSDEQLSGGALKSLIISNSIPPFRLSTDAVKNKLEIVDITPDIAAMIRGQAVAVTQPMTN